MSKKNQHYIPKFYLRFFSHQNDLKQIGIYNLKNHFFKQKVPLRHQCSKTFFYGEDEIIENFLSQMEGKFDGFFKEIISNKDLNKRDLEELHCLLTFFVLTDIRSLTSIENFKGFSTRFNALNVGVDMPEMGHQQTVNIMFSLFLDVLPTVLDLDYKLFKNSTNTKFITSDYPISKYNLLFETIPAYFSVTGYRSKGLIVFLPINPTLTVALFDKSTYKIGNKKDKVLNITHDKEIDQLNLLQFLNSHDAVFFNECISEEYIHKLQLLASKYTQPNLPQTFTANLKKSNGEMGELIVNRQNNTFIKLKISCISIHSGSNKLSLDPHIINLRK